jgi:carbonic anhydrase
MDKNLPPCLRWLSLFGLLALWIAPPAHAATWVNVAEGALGRSIYLDSESVQRDGLQVQAWTREVFTAEQRSPHTGVLYYSANTWTRFECGKRTIVPLTRVFYGGDGTEVRRIQLDQVELPEMITPGSLPERLLVEACRPPVAKKPAPTHVALAETKSKSDVPPGAAAEPVKTTADKDAKPEKAADKPAADKAAKPEKTDKPEKADAKKADAIAPAKPVEPGKSAADAKDSKPVAAVKPVLSKPIAHEFRPVAAPVVAPRYLDRPAMLPRPYRVKNPKAVKVALADGAKSDKAPAPEVRWSYEGSTGPAHWASLKPEYAACAAGKRQSPIDIQDSARLDLEPIKVDYRPAPLRIVDNGHTVQINYAEGSSISVAGVRYDLKQFHFHKPAEERINGKTYDMVAHLVHQSADGRLAVIAVLMESGMENAFLGGLWPHLPLESGHEITLPDVTIDVTALLPESRAYFAYMGSLSTPPCTEGVLWLVMRTPVTISPGQVAVFGKLYRINARPVQPGNGRLIKESL